MSDTPRTVALKVELSRLADELYRSADWRVDGGRVAVAAMVSVAGQLRALALAEPSTPASMLTLEEETAIVEDINTGRWGVLPPGSASAQPEPLDVERLLANFDRLKPLFTPDQQAAVAAVLFLTDERPSDERMAYYHELAVTHGWIAEPDR